MDVLRKIFEYLVVTDDIETVTKNLHEKNMDFIIKEKKKIYSQELDKQIYNNGIRDGYLYHGTFKGNIENILAKGLYTLDILYPDSMK